MDDSKFGQSLFSCSLLLILMYVLKSTVPCYESCNQFKYPRDLAAPTILGEDFLRKLFTVFYLAVNFLFSIPFFCFCSVLLILMNYKEI